MFRRATLVWFAILLVAIGNGALRQNVLNPRLGEGSAHVLSSVLLSVAIFAVTQMTIGWIQPAGSRDGWRMGLYWVALTVAFEFLAGHYMFGKDWSVLLADYQLAQGRIWILVLASTLTAPAVCAAVTRSARPGAHPAR